MPATDNTLAHLKRFLQQAGIPVGAFHDLLDKAIRFDYTDSEFMLAVYGSPQFKQMFPGIFRPDGSMKMTPLEYRNLEDSYRSAARQYGLSQLPKGSTAKLIKNDVSLQEFSDRMEAIKRVEEFKPAMDQFKAILESRGVKNFAGINTDKEIAKFLLGQGPKQFYSLWDELAIGTAAVQAGLDLDQQLIKSIAKTVPGQANEVEMQGRFANLAQRIKTVMPLSQMGKYGLTKQDLIDLEFGGPDQAAIAAKVDTIMRNHQAFATTTSARTTNAQRPQG